MALPIGPLPYTCFDRSHSLLCLKKAAKMGSTSTSEGQKRGLFRAPRRNKRPAPEKGAKRLLLIPDYKAG